MKNKISWVYNNLALSFLLGLQIFALAAVFIYLGKSLYKEHFPQQKESSTIVYTPPATGHDVKK